MGSNKHNYLSIKDNATIVSGSIPVDFEKYTHPHRLDGKLLNFWILE